MPISDEALQSEKNRFIAVKSEATIGQVLAALNALGGEAWWYVVVQMHDGSWAIARFCDLYASLEGVADPGEISMRNFKQLTAAAAIERDTLETKAAQALARKSPARVLVVTVKGLPVGILVEGVRRSSGALALSSASVDQLGGKYVKLKDYGTILLGSSKK